MRLTEAAQHITIFRSRYSAITNMNKLMFENPLSVTSFMYLLFKSRLQVDKHYIDRLRLFK